MVDFSLVLLLVCTIIPTLTCGASTRNDPILGKVLELTDLNFDVYVNSSTVWLVDIYAPWCAACRELQPLWVQLAESLAEDGVFLGSIDGTQEKGLMERFRVKHFPSIFHIADGETREYQGRRSLIDLKAYVQFQWRGTEARIGCSSPSSRCGRMLGEITKLPARAKSTYFHYRNEKKYSDVALFSGLLAVPVVFGLAVIAALDVYYSRRPLEVHHLHQH